MRKKTVVVQEAQKYKNIKAIRSTTASKSEIKNWIPFFSISNEINTLYWKSNCFENEYGAIETEWEKRGKKKQNKKRMF